eukprot:Gb_36755 [translate_table: standard]
MADPVSVPYVHNVDSSWPVIQTNLVHLGNTFRSVPQSTPTSKCPGQLCSKLEAVVPNNKAKSLKCLGLYSSKYFKMVARYMTRDCHRTLPAGYLELGESAAAGAVRETMEEACAEVEVVSPFAQLDIPLIAQSYLIFQAQFKRPYFSPGPESLECALFSLDEIPFESLAFSSIFVTLKMACVLGERAHAMDMWEIQEIIL